MKIDVCPETIFKRSIRLKQTNRTCWTIQTHSDELNWARRRTFHELNTLSLIRLMKSSTFGLGLWLLLIYKKHMKTKSLLNSIVFITFFYLQVCETKKHSSNNYYMYLGSNSCSGPLISEKRKKNINKLYNLKIIYLTASSLSFFSLFFSFQKGGFPLYISLTRSKGEKLFKYQSNSSSVIISLGSACDWLKICFNQSEALHRSEWWSVISMEFLRSFLRRHFAGKLVVASRKVGFVLRLVSSLYFSPLLTLAWWRVWLLQSFY